MTYANIDDNGANDTDPNRLIDVPCADCSRNVEVPARFFKRKSEQGIAIRCKTCIEEAASANSRRQGGIQGEEPE